MVLLNPTSTLAVLCMKRLDRLFRQLPASLGVNVSSTRVFLFARRYMECTCECVDRTRSQGLPQQIPFGRVLQEMKESPSDVAIGKPVPICVLARVCHR